MEHLLLIQQKSKAACAPDSNWKKQHWFHHLVDSVPIVEPLRDILHSLGLRRYNTIIAIVIYGGEIARCEITMRFRWIVLLKKKFTQPCFDLPFIYTWGR